MTEVIKSDGKNPNIRLLGQGAFGRVFGYKKGTTEYAIKQQYLSHTQEILNQMPLNELQKLHLLKNSDIVPKYYGFCVLNFSVFIIFERFREDLSKIRLPEYNPKLSRDKDPAKLIRLQRFKNVAQQLIASLEAIHKQKLVHQDIKGANILVVYRNQMDLKLVVGDLGVATHVDSEVFFGAGTNFYQPPELLTKT